MEKRSASDMNDLNHGVWPASSYSLMMGRRSFPFIPLSFTQFLSLFVCVLFIVFNGRHVT